MSVCLCVCMCVTKVVIVDYSQSIRFFVVTSFIKREGRYGSKDSKSRRTSKLNDLFNAVAVKCTLYLARPPRWLFSN